MLKLHLGCGNAHIDGYVNIDIRYLPSVDKVDNIKFLRSYAKNSVDVIYASHVLEHVGRWEYTAVLQRWFDLLKSGGVLRLAIPDFEAIAKYYLETGRLRDVSGMLYAGQDYQENNHFWCWDFKHISDELRAIGFINVERYDWRTTDHADLDDYSQSYLPHMDKDNGTLLSLNVHAYKG